MPSRGAVAVAVAVGLASPAVSASGAPEAPAVSEEILAEVGALFGAGQDRFAASDFEGAIDQWTRAYGLLPDEPEYRATRALLLANLAQAHVKAYEVSAQADHLRQADRLFGDYLALLDPADAQTRQTIEAERRRIEQILAQEPVPEPQAPGDPQPAPKPAESDELADESTEPGIPESGPSEVTEDPPESIPADPIPADSPADRDERPPFTRWERGMLVGGGVTVIGAAVVTGVFGTLVWLRIQAEDEGDALARDPRVGREEMRAQGQTVRLLRNSAISTGAVASLFGAVGLGLIGAALDHRTRRLRGLARVAPSWGSLGPGVTLSGRF
ncbi:MAG: hypothetical protein AAGF11_09845 [Myxococcota bacterium]